MRIYSFGKPIANKILMDRSPYKYVLLFMFLEYSLFGRSAFIFGNYSYLLECSRMAQR